MSAPSTLLYQVYDLDQHQTRKGALEQISEVNSTNFATYFDHHHAFAAVDLDQPGLRQWMQAYDGKPGIRWIHFWTDQSQRPLIESLALKYKLSPRLVGLLCPQTNESTLLSEKPDLHSTPKCRSLASVLWPKAFCGDVESAADGTQTKSLETASFSPKKMTFGDIVDDLWHFHSVDWDYNYVHVGVNVLCPISNTDYAPEKPTGKRLWSSIVLCHDGTVISTLERPSYNSSIADIQYANMHVKRHIMNIFSQISRLGENGNEMNLLDVRVRPEVGSADLSKPDQNQRMRYASLLFYYLFDDWMSAYALISRRESAYRASLEQVRQDLTSMPDVHVLETLHDIGQQLNVLKLMYQSYATVVTRLLARYRKISSSAAFAQHSTHHNDTSQADGQITDQPSPTDSLEFAPTQTPRLVPGDSTNMMAQSTSADVPRISDAALFRFERLLDRINLYALSEINHCIAEKESLSFMTFNLLALSESRTVEKLTRTTILLSKATIIFLPVSLLTAYYSIQVGNIAEKYTLKTYWISFVIVTLVSIVFLLIFSLATESVHGQPLHRVLGQSLGDLRVTSATRKVSVLHKSARKFS